MGRSGWILAGVLILALLVVGCGVLIGSPIGRAYGWGMAGPWMSGGWGMMGMMFLGPFLVLIVLGLLVGGIVWAIVAASRGGTSAPASSPAAEAPLDILKRRYASGELTQQQFDEMRKALSQS